MFQAVQLLLDRGVEVNTLLHQNLDRGPAFVRMLIEKGAKLDLKDATGRTPLDIALGVPPAVTAAPAGPAGGRGARGGPGGAAPAGPAAPIDPAVITLLRDNSGTRTK
jgi:hypothetical protein